AGGSFTTLWEAQNLSNTQRSWKLQTAPFRARAWAWIQKNEIHPVHSGCPNTFTPTAMLPYSLLPRTSSLTTQMGGPCPSLPSTPPEAAAPATFEVGNPGEDQFLPFKDSHTAQKRGP
ncbi:unnamed protein product, partial [Rangifer tarandus platyrhynchus]